MADIEVTTAPAETTIADADEIYFNDVSESPDAINRITYANFMARLRAGVLFADDFATLQDAWDALAASSANKLVLTSGTVYTIGAEVALDGADDKIIEGNGAEIRIDGGGTILGLHVTDCDNLTIRDLKFTSAANGTHVGIYSSGVSVDGLVVENCYFDGMYHAIFWSGNTRAIFDRIQVKNSINHGVYFQGEYAILRNSNIFNNAMEGVYIEGGNNSVVGCTIQYNDIGITVTTGGNSDHCNLVANTINHNTKAGIFLDRLIYGIVITGNNIAANGGGGLAENFAGSPLDSSFGVVIYQSTGVQLVSNQLLNNKFQVGIDGINNSVISNNTFTPLNTLTIRHCYEVGGTNVNYLFTNNIVIDDLLTNSVVLATDMAGATIPAGTNLVI